MNRFLPALLLLISVYSCSPLVNMQKTNRVVPALAPVIPFGPDTRIIYRASINISDKHLSGLFIFRQAPDHDFGYVSFISELGIEFLRLRLQDGELHTEYAMEALNRKIILNALGNFLLVILDDFDSSHTSVYKQKSDGAWIVVEKQALLQWEFWSMNEKNNPETISYYKGKKPSFILHLQYKRKGEVPHIIVFNHQRLPFHITLKKIQ